jgi:V8-like Glu-specific endopeptidase
MIVENGNRAWPDTCTLSRPAADECMLERTRMLKTLPLVLVILGTSFTFGAESWRSLPGQTSRSDAADGEGIAQIYNGVPTSDYPAVAGIAILNPDGTVAGCSGTLVSPSVVLTAAHCVASGPVAIRTVFFPGGGVRASHDVVAYDIHPEYSPFQLAVADVAVLLLESPVAGVTPMPLVTKTPRAGKKGTIVGYGQDETGNFGLKEFGTVKLKRCPRTFAPGGLSAGQLARSLCWRPKKGGQDTCHGDSGGPLLVKSAVAGVTSGGYPECPGILSWDTNVVPFLSWITPHLQ